MGANIRPTSVFAVVSYQFLYRFFEQFINPFTVLNRPILPDTFAINRMMQSSFHKTNLQALSHKVWIHFEALQLSYILMHYGISFMKCFQIKIISCYYLQAECSKTTPKVSWHKSFSCSKVLDKII